MLTNEQAKKNQEIYGWNEFSESKGKSIGLIFAEQFKDVLVIILIISAIISGCMGDIESSIVIFAVIVMNAVLGTVQTVKAEQSLNSLKQLSAPEAKVIRDGILMQISSREVTIGDEVILEAGDCIPADGKLLECASLKIDESALTGESVAVEKSLKEVKEDTALGDQVNRVFSGCFVTYGRGRFEVTQIGMQTEIGKIAGMLKNTSEKKTPLQISLDDFGKKLSVIILIFCAIIFAINIARGQAIGDAFMFAIALAVAAIPEALSSIVTIVLSFGTQKMAKEHAIVRKLQAVEGLGSVSVICSDKTGTLTQNQMTVEHCYVNHTTIYALNTDIKNKNQEFLLESSLLCNDAEIVDGQEIGDPTETAFIHLGKDLDVDYKSVRMKYSRLSEVPFDSERKLMSTLHKTNGKNIMITKGAVDVLLEKMTRIQIGDTVKNMTENDRNMIEMQNQQYSQNGLRVLAFAYKEIIDRNEVSEEDEDDLIFIGLIAMMDPPREESKAAVAACIKAGIKPVMITGDHKVTATAIARRVGILTDDCEACTGNEINAMSDEKLKAFVDGISVYARVSPEHKIRIVKAWQEKGYVVAMTGDGVNDAPALKQADIGVAMGITGSEVAKDAASMVLTDDNFATIVKAIENGRNIYKNIQNAIQFLLSGNFGAILVVLMTSIAGLPVPFAPVHLLFINLLTDSLPAIALGLEPHSKDVMSEKPRSIKKSILTKKYLGRIGIEGCCIGFMAFIAFMIGLKNGQATLASTMAFGTLCIARLFHGFNCKTDKPIIFSKRMFDNKYLTYASILGLILVTLVLIVPQMQSVFKVVTLNPVQILIVYILALSSLVLIQFLKAMIVWYRRKVEK